MFSAIAFEDCVWKTRPHGPGEPARHTAELSDAAGFVETRANLWRYEPGARGRRHVHAAQEETFVVLSGTLTMYLGEPAELCVVAAPGLIHVRAGTPLQAVNEGEDELLLYAYGAPPDEGAEVLPAAT
jgi:mannose-6-phosphate isomerase-like protein (cupin superfamily)